MADGVGDEEGEVVVGAVLGVGVPVGSGAEVGAEVGAGVGEVDEVGSGVGVDPAAGVVPEVQVTELPSAERTHTICEPELEVVGLVEGVGLVGATGLPVTCVLPVAMPGTTVEWVVVVVVVPGVRARTTVWVGAPVVPVDVVLVDAEPVVAPVEALEVTLRTVWPAVADEVLVVAEVVPGRVTTIPVPNCAAIIARWTTMRSANNPCQVASATWKAWVSVRLRSGGSA